MELHTASRQWATRPADERFLSLHALAAFKKFERQQSARRVVANRDIFALPSATDPLDFGIEFRVNGKVWPDAPMSMTNWSFGQLCGLAGVPAGYILRSKMPGALAADNLNWGLHHHRKPESVSALFQRNGQLKLAAANGPDYGPVWDNDIADTLVNEFGDGVTGDWRVPGEFGKRLDAVTKANTTLYASDRDMWVFLADEDRRIELPQRRNGKTGSFARGFYIGNSQVGARTLTLGTFLFDYVCCNRIIWGADQFSEIKIRHTATAPHRWLEEVKPVLTTLSQASPMPMQDALRHAQQQKIKGDVEKFLETRFGAAASRIAQIHIEEEARPIETTWDAIVGATAFARGIEHQDERIRVERLAGGLLAQRVSAREIEI